MAGQWVIEDDPATPGQWVIEDGPTVSAPLSRSEKIGKGLRDPFDGGAQLLTNVLPGSVVNAGNKVNNWLADKTGMVARIPEGGVNQMVADGEREYQDRRKAGGESGFDGYRTIGNIFNPANVAIASRLPMGATLGARIGLGAGGGAASSALAPVTNSENYGKEKTQQVLTGAAFGGAVPLVTGAVARGLSPNASINPKMRTLQAEGVRPTIGQSLGGWANRTEEKMQSLPFVGSAITKARESAGADLNRAVANRALRPIGKELPEGVTGNDAVLFVRKAMNDAYDEIAPALAVTKDQQFKTGVSGLQAAVRQGAINPNAKKAFDRFVKNDLDPLFQGQQAMTGETFKRLQSKITEKIQQTAGTTDADQRVLNGAYKELGDQLNDLLMRTNPNSAERLQAINLGYANFKRMQRAASSVAADEGVFTPAMLQNAVKAADRSKDKARFAEGNALMQDLSSAGKSMLQNKVPNSGTTDRLLMTGGTLGLGGAGFMLDPMIPLGMAAAGGAGGLLYTQPAQSLLRGLVAARPGFAQPTADVLRKAAPALVPGGSQLGLGLLNQ